MFQRTLLFGDEVGLPVLLNRIAPQNIVAVVIASIRAGLSKELTQKINDLNIPILIQPSYGTGEYYSFLSTLKLLKPDSLFCNSYSMLIRKDMLDLVSCNAFNIHASYLPYNKGPNPIQWALIKGEEYTGVTLHCMDADFDTGDIVYQEKEPIHFEDTWLTLRDRLSQLIVKITDKMIPLILEGNFKTIPQSSGFGPNYRLTPEFPKIDFETMSDVEIYNLIRAQVNPLKGAYVEIEGKHRYYFNEYIPLNLIPAFRQKWSSLVS